MIDEGRSPCGSGFSFLVGCKQKLVGANEIDFHRIHHNSRRIFNAQLGHDIFPVGIYCMIAQEKLFGDLLVGLALCNALDDFVFPVGNRYRLAGEMIEFQVVNIDGSGMDRFEDLPAEKFVAFGRFFDGVDNLVDVTVFFHITFHTSPQGSHQGRGALFRSDSHDPDFGSFGHDGRDNINIKPACGVIDQDHIGIEISDKLE